MTNIQLEQAGLLHDLHIKGEPLVLINVWDAGSAKAVQEIGAKAVATGSWSVAAAHGYDDGEKLPLDLVLGPRPYVQVMDMLKAIGKEALAVGR